MGIAIEIILGALISYWVSGATGLPFWMAAIGVVAIYFAVTRGLGIGGGGVGIFTGLGNLFRGVKNLAIGLGVFTALMMIATRVIGVSNNYASSMYGALGWRPWLWPHGVATDLLLWTSIAFVVAGVAARAAEGRWKVAMSVFGLSAVVIFTMMWMPRTGEAVRPKPKTAVKPTSGETQGWADTDQKVAESGVIPTTFCTVYKWGLGNRWPCSGKALFPSFWNSQAASVTTRTVVVSSPAAAVPAKVGKRPTSYTFRGDGCVEIKIQAYDFAWYARGGRITTFPPNGGASFVTTPGVDGPVTHFLPGMWKWCRLDPDATGVEIWQ